MSQAREQRLVQEPIAHAAAGLGAASAEAEAFAGGFTAEVESVVFLAIKRLRSS